MEIKYKKMREGLPDLKVNPKGDWIDLYLAEDVHLQMGEFALLPLGVRVKLPDRFEAHIVPRSSTFKNFKILQANSVGIVDSSYCGPEDEWKMPVYATDYVTIQKGTRICQFRIMPSQFSTIIDKEKWLKSSGIWITQEEWLQGDEISRGGFGSTGV